ncbi:MAG: hypothetical protein RJQ14_06200, partial [Marinoscillum sp.]
SDTNCCLIRLKNLIISFILSVALLLQRLKSRNENFHRKLSTSESTEVFWQNDKIKILKSQFYWNMKKSANRYS